MFIDINIYTVYIYDIKSFLNYTCYVVGTTLTLEKLHPVSTRDEIHYQPTSLTWCRIGMPTNPSHLLRISVIFFFKFAVPETGRTCSTHDQRQQSSGVMHCSWRLPNDVDLNKRNHHQPSMSRRRTVVMRQPGT